MTRDNDGCARGTGAAAVALLVGAMLLTASPARAVDGDKPQADAAEIATLVKQLGDDSYAVREAAQKKLIEIGPPARDAVAAAVESKDPEVSTRAKAILEAIADASARQAAEAIKKNLLWKAPLANGVKGPPKAAKGVVCCVSNASELRAIDAKTGKGLWKFKTNGQAWTLSDRTVYTPDANGNLSALDIRTGKVRPAFTPRAVFGPPTAAGGMIVVGGLGKTLWALDARSGKTLKEIKVSDAVVLAPAVAGDKAYVLTRDGKVQAADLTAGKILWAARAAKTVAHAIAVRDGRVIVHADEKLLAFDAADGKTLWSAPISEKPRAAGLVGRVAVAQRRGAAVRAAPAPLAAEAKGVYLATARGVVAFDPTRGAKLWEYKLPDAEAAPAGNPFGGNVVIMGGGLGGNVQVRIVMGGAQGAQVFQMVNGRVVASAGLAGPALADGVAYVGGVKGLHAIDTRTHKRLWTFKTPQPVVETPVIADGVVYFATHDPAGQKGTTLYALCLPTDE